MGRDVELRYETKIGAGRHAGRLSEVIIRRDKTRYIRNRLVY